MGTTTALRRALKQDFFAFVEKRGFRMDQRDQPRSTVFRRSVGLLIQGQAHQAGSVFPGRCPDAGSLQPRRGTGTRSWFRQDRSLLQRLFLRPAMREPSEVAGELLALFPELEHYWATGEVGRHMRIWNHHPPGLVQNAV
jgi:hypothetical protein